MEFNMLTPKIEWGEAMQCNAMPNKVIINITTDLWK